MAQPDACQSRARCLACGRSGNGRGGGKRFHRPKPFHAAL
ncbi:AzlC family protein [Caballeronia sordidicola]|uniref:AzlC family protein n=1 Tax=Caballeronia sordidicola TaxID=196367 RepID=A0A226WUT7_CABSO|nr:AzlC family protein [Caballeronia sordidicola]